jgi:hypothetical protein
MALYLCPVDKYLSTTNADLCKHIMTIAEAKHQEWVDSHHGLSYGELVLTGDYSPLAKVVEKECRVE